MAPLDLDRIGGKPLDFATAYCPTRRNLEENGWWLTSRLAALTGRLLKMAGQRNHLAFLEIRQECAETRTAISDSHRDLREHRREHGC